MLLPRHAARLIGEFVSYARLNRAWWLLPVVGMLAVVVAFDTATQATVPVAVYTLF